MQSKEDENIFHEELKSNRLFWRFMKNMYKRASYRRAEQFVDIEKEKARTSVHIGCNELIYS